MQVILLSDGSFRFPEDKVYREGESFIISAGGRKCLATVVGIARNMQEAAELANSAGPILQQFHQENLEAADQFRMEIVDV